VERLLQPKIRAIFECVLCDFVSLTDLGVSVVNMYVYFLDSHSLAEV